MAEDYRDYIGREERRRDVITAGPLEGVAALLDATWAEVSPRGVLPPLWHWFFFLHWVRRSEIGPDGHPRRGRFLPPVALPRRMFAGGRLTFHGALRVGDPVERVSTIQSVQEKTGASGPLVFVTVRHELSGPGGLAVVEEQDLVYRGPDTGAARQAAEPPPEPLPAGAWRREVNPDPVTLFRFSALTANGHRIHYDRQYATGVEGYPGLVVHGPLQAILLLDLLRRERPDREVRAFEFRARRPLFDGSPFWCVGYDEAGRVELSTRDAQGRACMTARATPA
ncbi:MAG TPA: MaoC family dehydratase N-terminal domain-containing protein [Thermodesulfobacteriota bacterium]